MIQGAGLHMASMGVTCVQKCDLSRLSACLSGYTACSLVKQANSDVL